MFIYYQYHCSSISLFRKSLKFTETILKEHLKFKLPFSGLQLYTNLAWSCRFFWESFSIFWTTLFEIISEWLLCDKYSETTFQKFLKTIVPNNVSKTSRKYLRRSSYLVTLLPYNPRVHKNFANLVKYLWLYF